MGLPISTKKPVFSILFTSLLKYALNASVTHSPFLTFWRFLLTVLEQSLSAEVVEYLELSINAADRNWVVITAMFVGSLSSDSVKWISFSKTELSSCISAFWM